MGRSGCSPLQAEWTSVVFGLEYVFVVGFVCIRLAPSVIGLLKRSPIRCRLVQACRGKEGADESKGRRSFFVLSSAPNQCPRGDVPVENVCKLNCNLFTGEHSIQDQKWLAKIA